MILMWRIIPVLWQTAIHLISGGAGYYINSNAPKYIHENIAGFQGDKTFSASLKGGEDKIIYWNFIENIQHSPDGSSSFWIGFDVGLNVTLSGVYWGNVSISDTVNLTKIARKSTLSVGNATIGAGSFHDDPQTGRIFYTQYFLLLWKRQRNHTGEWDKRILDTAGVFGCTDSVVCFRGMPAGTYNICWRKRDRIK